MQRDLKIAEEIQSGLLAQAAPKNLSNLCCFNEAAQNVGGDFFYAQCLPEGGCAFAIGDVSGKGIPAALLMAQLLSSLEFVFQVTRQPSEALAQINATLFSRIVRGMFATLLLGRFKDGQLELSSAGHCKPYRLSKGTASEIEVPASFPIGVMPILEAETHRIALPPGDILLAFTDGLTESRDPASDQFLGDELSQLLQRPFQNPHEVVDFLVNSERHHRRSQPHSDDLTLLAFQG